MTPPLALVLALALLPLALSRREFLQRIPNGDAWSRPGSGITCQFLGHNDCVEGAPRNAFGRAFAANGLVWDKALCEMDSDNDGLTNGEELGDPCCEWNADTPSELRTDQLSHPGDENETGASDAPGCEQDDTPTTGGTPPTTEEEPTTAPASSTGPTPSAVEAVESPAAEETPGTPTVVSGDPTRQPPDDGVCFPGHATVKLQCGAVKEMRHVQIGDRVQVGPQQFSDVFMFTHKMKDVLHEFVTVEVGNEDQVSARVTLTQGHYLYVNDKLATAGSVVVGDQLELVSGERRTVVSVSCALHMGLFNPQTTHGDLVVDGIRVSTYTTAVETGMAHSLLAPLRMLYRLSGWTTSVFEAGADRIVALLRN